MRRSTQGWLDREMCHWDCKQSLGLQTVGKYMSTQCFQKKRATLVAMRFLSSLGEGDTRGSVVAQKIFSTCTVGQGQEGTNRSQLEGKEIRENSAHGLEAFTVNVSSLP
eukprot:scaffold39383_cov16-Tisochrysis_lutea.AAC.1